MNKEIEMSNLSNHNINIVERQNLSISGVLKIDSFDSEEFILETSLGMLGIKGRDLEIIKLDTYDGKIIIKGIIDGFSYFDDKKDKKESNFMSRLFK